MAKKTYHRSANPGLTRESREKYLGQRGKVIWFTGLSGSGKTTLATKLAFELSLQGFFCQILDGDIVRNGISKNLGFSEEDRSENVRRVAEMARLLLDNGIVVICAFISPTIEIRRMAQEIIGYADFLEIYVSTPLEVCEQRDPKGLYKKARQGIIPDFTGISAPFESPQNPFMQISNSETSTETLILHILKSVLPEIALL